MKRLHVLLASSDRTGINRIEALVHDLCFERVMVECKRIAKLEDFEKLSLCSWMDLVIFSPDNLLTSGRTASRNLLAESLRSVRQARKGRFLPFIAFGVSEHNASEVLEAGVEVVLGPVWDREQMRTELGRVLNLPARVEEPVPAKWDFLRLLRGFTLVKSKA
jgi:hypothetical protein